MAGKTPDGMQQMKTNIPYLGLQSFEHVSFAGRILEPFISFLLQ
jgi:hypothetical protein